jgi:hypothetical protein
VNDWIGLLFFVLPAAGIYIGLKILSKPHKRTEAEFERGAAQSASMLSASIGALQEILDPAETKAKETRMQLKEGRYNKKRREGKAGGKDLNEENND